LPEVLSQATRYPRSAWQEGDDAGFLIFIADSGKNVMLTGIAGRLQCTYLWRT
jgi:hypothetical protein